jgi:hypothetical protein
MNYNPGDLQLTFISCNNLISSIDLSNFLEQITFITQFANLMNAGCNLEVLYSMPLSSDKLYYTV